MKLIALSLIFLFACSQLTIMVDDKPRTDIQFVSHGKYQEIRGAENLLRDVSGATLQVTFKTDEHSNEPQDLISFSIGGSETKTLKSRAAMRIEPGGYLVGLGRAKDEDEIQTVRSSIPVELGKSQTATVAVNYSQNSIKLYLDGKVLPVTGKVAFGAPKTSNTPSINASLGSEDDGSTFFFKGDLRNPRIWTRALSDDEIIAHSKE